MPPHVFPSSFLRSGLVRDSCPRFSPPAAALHPSQRSTVPTTPVSLAILYHTLTILVGLFLRSTHCHCPAGFHYFRVSSHLPRTLQQHHFPLSLRFNLLTYFGHLSTSVHTLAFPGRASPQPTLDVTRLPRFMLSSFLAAESCLHLLYLNADHYVAFIWPHLRTHTSSSPAARYIRTSSSQRRSLTRHYLSPIAIRPLPCTDPIGHPGAHCGLLPDFTESRLANEVYLYLCRNSPVSPDLRPTLHTS